MMSVESSGGGRWTRRGEWLEATPGKVITGAEDTDAAIDKWLLETVRMPEKLHVRLRREGKILWKGDRLRLGLFPDQEAGIEPIWQEEILLQVLHEDDFCLVVHKPAGIAVHPDGSGKGITLDHLVAAHFAAAGESIAVRHIHRLDKDTTGPVLYAKNEFAQLALDEQMREKTISRLYVAIVHGKVSPGLKVIDQPIGRDRHHAARRRVSPGGQAAITRIIGREVWNEASLLHVQLETGRTHQIRVHLSHAGHPLIGDELYGESADGAAGGGAGASRGPRANAWGGASAGARDGDRARAGAGSGDRARGGAGFGAGFGAGAGAGTVRGLRAGASDRARGGAGLGVGTAASLGIGPKGTGGSPKLNFGRQALHGASLTFRHPWSGEKLEINDPMPDDMSRLRDQLSGN